MYLPQLKCTSRSIIYTQDEEGVIKAEEIVKKVCAALESKKGGKIKLLDVRGVSGITDYFVIVSGSSSPHLKAMFEEVHYALKKDGVNCYRKTGNAESGWMVLDYVDVIVHILSAEAREYYGIETLWQKPTRQAPQNRVR